MVVMTESSLEPKTQLASLVFLEQQKVNQESGRFVSKQFLRKLAETEGESPHLS